MMGVAKTIREDQINALSDTEQDDLIRELGHALEKELRDYVKDATPLGDLVYQVQGPFIDPIQGKVWTHVLAGNFDLDRLDHTSSAYLTHVTNPDPTKPALDIQVPE